MYAFFTIQICIDGRDSCLWILGWIQSCKGFHSFGNLSTLDEKDWTFRRDESENYAKARGSYFCSEKYLSCTEMGNPDCRGIERLTLYDMALGMSMRTFSPAMAITCPMTCIDGVRRRSHYTGRRESGAYHKERE